MNKKQPGRKFIPTKEYKSYIELLKSEDIECVLLAISLFKESKTYKHYKYSPIESQPMCKILDHFESLTISQRDPFVHRALFLKLHHWMLNHSL